MFKLSLEWSMKNHTKDSINPPPYASSGYSSLEFIWLECKLCQLSTTQQTFSHYGTSLNESPYVSYVPVTQ